MAFTIAVAGKGGTGKTTIAALVVRALRQAGARSVLAVDADPNACLHESLGTRSSARWERSPRRCSPTRTRTRAA